MKLSIKKLGVISEGCVDLGAPLTVFCGLNGSGKTYLSYVISAIVGKEISPVHNVEDELWNCLVTTGKITIDIDAEDISAYRRALLKQLRARFDVIFGISIDEAKRMLSEFEISFTQSAEEFIDALKEKRIGFNIHLLGKKFVVIKKAGTTALNISHDLSKPMSDEMQQISRALLLGAVFKKIVLNNICNSHFLPVERSAVNTFSKELTTQRRFLMEQLKKKASRPTSRPLELSEIINSNTINFPVAISDALEMAEDLSSIKRRTGAYASFADEIEREILHGSLEIDDDGSISFTNARGKEQSKCTIPLIISASAVKTLASLIILLRHRAVRNDLIIIDEPELNLHPVYQIVLARIFVRMINSGLRLLISTHSDYIIRELNNAIMLHYLEDKDGKIKSELGYIEKSALNPVDANVYEFISDESTGSIVLNHASIDRYGFEVLYLDQAIDLINGTAERLALD